MPIEAGQQLLHYRLLEKIGEGRMGVVCYLKKPNVTDTDCCSAAAFPSYVSPLTTTVYTHPSDEEMRNRLRSLRC